VVQYIEKRGLYRTKHRRTVDGHAAAPPPTAGIPPTADPGDQNPPHPHLQEVPR
jgi:hypothetical protein